MTKITAVYIRVSTKKQDTGSQKVDLKRWVEAQDPEKIGQVKWYEDKATGKTMDRPDWQKLQAAMDTGQVSRLVVWRLDRLGRTASGLCKLFDELQDKKVRLISLKDAIDLGTASGRLMANMLASVAAFETELRGERVRAGQEAARARGKRWGGSKPGNHYRLTPEKQRMVKKLLRDGEPKAAIARAVGVARRTIYNYLQ